MGTLPERFRTIVGSGGYSELRNEGNDSVITILFDNTPTGDVKRLYGVQRVLMDKNRDNSSHPRCQFYRGF